MNDRASEGRHAAALSLILRPRLNALVAGFAILAMGLIALTSGSQPSLSGGSLAMLALDRLASTTGSIAPALRGSLDPEEVSADP